MRGSDEAFYALFKPLREPADRCLHSFAGPRAWEEQVTAVMERDVGRLRTQGWCSWASSTSWGSDDEEEGEGERERDEGVVMGLVYGVMPAVTSLALAAERRDRHCGCSL